MENNYSESRSDMDLEKHMPENLPSGNDPAYLPKTKKWNWGACLLNCFWLPFFRFDAGSVILFIANIILCGIPSLFFCIYLGNKGGEIAWRYRQFDSVQQYEKVLKAWDIWAIVVNIIILIIFIACIIASFALWSWAKQTIGSQLNSLPGGLPI